MAGPAPSAESTLRRGLRLALGVTLAFVFAQLVGWPVAHPAPVFAALLLQESGPQTVRQGLAIFGTAFASVLSGYLVALALIPYPLVMVLVLCLLLYRFYIFAITAGAPILALVGLILGLILMPVLALALPEAAFIVGFGLLVDFAVGIMAAWIAFSVIPAPAVRSEVPSQAPSHAVAAPIAARLTIAAAPLLIAFLVFGWTSIIVLIYGALFALAMSSEKAADMGGESLLANLVFGGVGVLLAYELLVMVPNLGFMVVLIFAICILYGGKIFGGQRAAGLWGSGFNGFLLLLGAALLSDDAVVEAALIDRLWQIGLATAYLVFAYRVIDLVDSLVVRSSKRA